MNDNSQLSAAQRWAMANSGANTRQVAPPVGSVMPDSAAATSGYTGPVSNPGFYTTPSVTGGLYNGASDSNNIGVDAAKRDALIAQQAQAEKERTWAAGMSWQGQAAPSGWTAGSTPNGAFGGVGTNPMQLRLPAPTPSAAPAPQVPMTAPSTDDGRTAVANALAGVQPNVGIPQTDRRFPGYPAAGGVSRQFRGSSMDPNMRHFLGWGNGSV